MKYITRNFELQLKAEAVAQMCSVKKVLLEILQNSQESTCARIFFNTKKETHCVKYTRIRVFSLILVLYRKIRVREKPYSGIYCTVYPTMQYPAVLVTFIEEILNGKLYFLCSARVVNVYSILQIIATK